MSRNGHLSDMWRERGSATGVRFIRYGVCGFERHVARLGPFVAGVCPDLENPLVRLHLSGRGRRLREWRSEDCDPVSQLEGYG